MGPMSAKPEPKTLDEACKRTGLHERVNCQVCAALTEARDLGRAERDKELAEEFERMSKGRVLDENLLFKADVLEVLRARKSAPAEPSSDPVGGICNRCGAVTGSVTPDYRGPCECGGEVVAAPAEPKESPKERRACTANHEKGRTTCEFCAQENGR
jgi:hypothetical protein